MNVDTKEFDLWLKRRMWRWTLKERIVVYSTALVVGLLWLLRSLPARPIPAIAEAAPSPVVVTQYVELIRTQYITTTKEVPIDYLTNMVITNMVFSSLNATNMWTYLDVATNWTGTNLLMR